MLPDKIKIRRSFSEAASTYDSSSGLQMEVADELAAMAAGLAARKEYACQPSLAPMPVFAGTDHLVLDIGCGTGRLIGSLKRSFPGSIVLGSDIALPMVMKARENLKACGGLTVSDCESLPFMDSIFDMVVSSLTYQWTDISASISEAQRVLKPGGLFLFSTLGPMTLRELRECTGAGAPAAFKDAVEVSSELKRAGFEEAASGRKTIVKRYGSLKELARTLKNIGAAPRPSGCRDKGLSKGAPLRRAGAAYEERFPSPEGGIVATYEIIFASGVKGAAL
ncbi:MAG: methyltransferase domain-containing protein [Deltaproteobacteria bacterium]|nr:methyltransferase domain-containing protein [Deltaproteobacteria bacterium]